MINKITENYPEETFLRANCFDGAIIGVEEKSMTLIYSVKKCIEIWEQKLQYGVMIFFKM